jgi:hypothetical protein
VFVHAHEIDDVATRFAPETHEPLLLDVDKKARITVLVEWTQPLPAMGSGSLQADAEPLHHL